MKYVNVRGAQVRYDESGDAAAPPVVPLLGADHRVISIDLPGFGLSQRLPEHTTLPTLAQGVWAGLDAIGETRPVHLMGNSLGGAVSMQMVVDEPARVSTLTLVNSAGFGKEVTFALRMLAIPGMGRPLLGRIDELTAPQVERVLFASKTMVTPERVAMAIKVSRQPDFATVYLEIARELGGFWGVADRWRAELLPQVALLGKPMLLVWGDRDKILPVSHLTAARLAFPKAQWHLFEATGHMPQIERPDEFAAVVRKLLAQVSA
jgi:pimeloyl-ACP methyl ester carboxylesterase